jgi:hypothetical protein
MLLPLGMKLPLGHAAFLCMLLSRGHAAKAMGHHFVTQGFSLRDVSLHLALNFVTLFQKYFRYSNICFHKYFFSQKSLFHIKLMHFSSFGSISAVLGAFYIRTTNFFKNMYYLHM